jgi:hypothetical protein
MWWYVSILHCFYGHIKYPAVEIHHTPIPTHPLVDIFGCFNLLAILIHAAVEMNIQGFVWLIYF